MLEKAVKGNLFNNDMIEGSVIIVKGKADIEDIKEGEEPKFEDIDEDKSEEKDAIEHNHDIKKEAKQETSVVG